MNTGTSVATGPVSPAVVESLGSSLVVVEEVVVGSAVEVAGAPVVDVAGTSTSVVVAGTSVVSGGVPVSPVLSSVFGSASDLLQPTTNDNATPTSLFMHWLSATSRWSASRAAAPRPSADVVDRPQLVGRTPIE